MSERPSAELVELVDRLRNGAPPHHVQVLKQSPVRAVVRTGDTVLKVFLVPGARRRAARETRNLLRARRLGIRVPELVASGPGWVATAWVEGRPAHRRDLPLILLAAERMHTLGMLHGDFHLGNLHVSGDEVVLFDLQRSRFHRWIPSVLRRRELGFLAYSLGEPLPRELEAARRWHLLRAHVHWRSRTRRCLIESSGFSAFEALGVRGFRRREIDPAELRSVLGSLDKAETLKAEGAERLLRARRWILKEHSSPRAARLAWVAGCGLEARGVTTGKALAWSGRWLVMEDAGETVTDWTRRAFADAGASAREELALSLGDLLALLHRRGIYHADLKANNIAWRPGEPPRLLDYGRVHFGLRVGERRRIKNLAQLNAALPDTVPSALRMLAFDRYLVGCDYNGDADTLLHRVVAESVKRGHLWTGCEEPASLTGP